LADLSSDSAHEAVTSAFAGGESLHDNAHDLGHLVQLQLLVDVSVLFALPAVPLVIATQSF